MPPQLYPLLAALLAAIPIPLAARRPTEDYRGASSLVTSTGERVQVPYIIVRKDVLPGNNADYLSFLSGIGDVGTVFKEEKLDEYMSRLLLGSSGGFVVDSPWWAGTGIDMPKVVQMWYRSKTAGELLTAANADSRHSCFAANMAVSKIYPRTYIVLPVTGLREAKDFLTDHDLAQYKDCLRYHEVDLEAAQSMVAAATENQPAFKTLIDHTVGPVLNLVRSTSQVADNAFDFAAMQTVAGAGLVLQVLDLAEDIINEIKDALVGLIVKILEPIVRPIRNAIGQITKPIKDAIELVMQQLQAGWNGVLPISPTTDAFKQVVYGVGENLESTRERAVKIFKADPTREEPYDPHQPGKVVEFLDSFSHNALSHFLMGASEIVPNDPTCARALQEGSGTCMLWEPEGGTCSKDGAVSTCCHSSGTHSSAACQEGSTCNGGEDASALYAGGCSRGPCLSYMFEKKQLWNREKRKNTAHMQFRSCDGDTRLNLVTVELEKGELIPLDPVGILALKAKLDSTGKVLFQIGLVVPGLSDTFTSFADFALPFELLPDADRI